MPPNQGAFEPDGAALRSVHQHLLLLEPPSRVSLIHYEQPYSEVGGSRFGGSARFGSLCSPRHCLLSLVLIIVSRYPLKNMPRHDSLDTRVPKASNGTRRCGVRLRVSILESTTLEPTKLTSHWYLAVEHGPHTDTQLLNNCAY